MPRSFEATDAVPGGQPCLVGLAGPSGCGKTMSALRIATGMQRVIGGDIHVIDTESKRALWYADDFKFKHVPFKAPFSPDDYREAIAYCVKQGASIVVVDSLSHEHDGPGGVLEWHDNEMGGDFSKSHTAWAKPKAARRKLINAITQLGVHGVFCFRAKEKLDYAPKGGWDGNPKDKQPKQLGWMPIAGEEFVFEMTVQCLLYPSSGGVPTWKTDKPGERMMIKSMAKFAHLFKDAKPLDEDLGEALARLSSGKAASSKPAPEAEHPTDSALDAVLAEIDAAPDSAALEMILSEARQLDWTPDEMKKIAAAKKAKRY